MGVNVKNGTTPYGPSLCETCVHGHIERGYRETEERTYCEATYRTHRVLFPVRECSAYTERKRQTLKQMEDIAWLLEPRGPKRVAGFAPPGSANDGDNAIELILTEPEPD
jgi:hypothetical protein